MCETFTTAAPPAPFQRPACQRTTSRCARKKNLTHTQLDEKGVASLVSPEERRRCSNTLVGANTQALAYI